MKNRINKVSLKEQVYNILFERIVSGELAPGDRVKIIPTAKELGVSQAPVREAVQCLVTSGYMELEPNVGARVKTYSTSEICDIYEVRQLLEIGAINSTHFDCQMAHDKMVVAFSGMIEAAKTNSYRDYALFDTEFHRALVESSNNLKMVEMWDTLLVPKHITGILKQGEIELEEMSLVHEPIIEALKQNEVAKVILELKNHYTILNM